MKRPSGSSLHLLHNCIGSHVYPQVFSDGEAAKKGRAAHVELEKLVKAAATIPGLGSSENYAPEISFAYDCEKGTARVLGASLGRDYGKLGPDEIPMTADILGENSEAVIIGDWKVKNGWEGPARDHAQLRALALAAARCGGKKTAHVFWIKFDPESLPEFVVTWKDSATFGEMDLDCIEDEIRESYRRWKKAIAEFKEGREPNLSEGPWCQWCPSFRSCRAKTGLVRYVAQPASLEDALRGLMPEEMGRAYQVILAGQQVLHKLRWEVEEYAKQHPVPLPDGRVLQLVEGRSTERVTDPRKVAEYLAGAFGAEVALSACELDASKASIERALKAAHQGPALKDVLSALREMGAIQRKQGEPKVMAVGQKKDEEAA